MRSTQQNLSIVREELAQIQRELTRLQQRIEAVRDSVADSIVRLFGQQGPSFRALDEEELIERIASGAESAFVFIHPSNTCLNGGVMSVTNAFPRTCDTHFVNMVWKASKKVFLEPGDTS